MLLCYTHKEIPTHHTTRFLSIMCHEDFIQDSSMVYTGPQKSEALAMQFRKRLRTSYNIPGEFCSISTP